MAVEQTFRIGPENSGERMALALFARAEGQEGWRYELDQGVVSVVEVPGFPHAGILRRVRQAVTRYELAHPGVIAFSGGGGECVMRLPRMQSERHPDWAIYLTRRPDAVDPWDHWVPEIVVEVVSPSSADRDYGVKREEYLAAGCREYWILDSERSALLVLRRRSDTWEEHEVTGLWSTPLLPGFELDTEWALTGETPA